MVDLLFGNVKEILLFELIFQNDLEEAKEMIRDDSSFHVGVVFVEKALVRLLITSEVFVSWWKHFLGSSRTKHFWKTRLKIS